jgi:hypothetical protein
MSANYNYQIAALGLPAIEDERQLNIAYGSSSSLGYFEAARKRQQATVDYVREAEQQHKPTVDLYNVAVAPGAGDFAEKIPAQNGMKAYRLGPDTLLLHSHHTPHD